ncbi:MAG: hypothetical protein VX938_04250, partial [Myxococcota bacterium]|nr:hypothetical protein [Myxococcota bacterium]
MDQVTSTNDVALELAQGGAPSGTLVMADQQTGGRGRRGRSWFSPPGANVYLSCVHRSRLPMESLAGLTLDVANAVATTLEDL